MSQKQNNSERINLMQDYKIALRLNGINEIYTHIQKAYDLYSTGKFHEAYGIIEPICEFIKLMSGVGDFLNNIGMYQCSRIFQLAGDICGEAEMIDLARKYYAIHQFFGFQLKSDFEKETKIQLFHFRNTKKYTLQNLINNQFTLVDPRIQNDIVDAPILRWLDCMSNTNCLHSKHLGLYKESFKGFHSVSFCMDSAFRKAIENTLMWAHYANSHKGICVEYELDSCDFRRTTLNPLKASRLYKVSYSDSNSQPLDFTNPEIALSFRNGFAYKSSCWEYEQEVRLISYTLEYSQRFVQYQIQTKNPIKAIYFGVKCSSRRRNLVKNILSGRGIKYYQMKFNPKDIHRLIFEEC